MKNNHFFIVFLIVIGLLGNAPATNARSSANPANIEPLVKIQDWIACTVSDPTGTPLNVRAKPNGRIIARLKNDTLVEIDDSTAGNKWSRISFRKGRGSARGWVLRAYLSCQ
jgi:Bacterial SH3 domain